MCAGLRRGEGGTHRRQVFLSARATAIDIAETLYNYPTQSDLYRHAAHEAFAEHYSLTGRRAWVSGPESNQPA